MADSPRLSELRRRVDSDPASIAFAQLAEEYRRSGRYEDAARVCRAGLSRHPTYLSARVTLGRALIELGQLDDAESELTRVLQSAPDNLAAMRGLAETQRRRGNLREALAMFQKAHGMARHDAELEEAIHDLSRQLYATEGHPVIGNPPGAHAAAVDASSAGEASRRSGGPRTIPLSSLSPELEAAADEFTKALQALDALSLNLPAPPEAEDAERAGEAAAPAAASPGDEAVLRDLEGWLEAIVRDRQARAARS